MRAFGKTICAALFALFAMLSALVFAAARSDFTARGCPDMPRAEWALSANCADGWLGQVVFGALAMLLAAAASLLFWRRRV